MWIRSCALFATGCLLLLAAGARADDAEDKAIEAIKKVEGKMTRDARADGKPVIFVSLIDTKVTDADLQSVAAFKKVQVIDLNSTPITDAGMKHLAGLEHL